ncbi:unnamed protein product [Gadus morhua 'NCC']
MAQLSQNRDLETDGYMDWSHIKKREDSFLASEWAKQVSALKLARAGFYYTGSADRVQCFSCRKTVENWCTGDQPVERHKEVSPSCQFLRCAHRAVANGLASNGTPYSEEEEDLQYRLRTGEVVDETTYPMVPHMCSEDARLQTFQPWPSSAPVRPRALAQAGLFYLGEGDRVQCFCCAGMMGGWEAGDTAWGEHSKHFANCFFILGHDVGNVPSQGGAAAEEEEEEEERVALRGSGVIPLLSPSKPMGSFEERLESYAGIQHPIDSRMLASAGFYSTGGGDRVVCFQCGGGVKNWLPDEEPWMEHAKHYPGCLFLLSEKGQDFVNQVQLQEPRRNGAASSQNGFSRQQNDVLKSEMAAAALAIGLDPVTVERTIRDKLCRTGSDYPSVEALIQDCLNNPATRSTSEEEDPSDILHRLQREKQCKICMDRDICMVFIPCGHLVSCSECSQSLGKCPICCASITQKVKTYIA